MAMKNPDKAAIDYLIASGASCVSVLADGTIKAGPKPDRAAVSAWWLPEDKVIAVSRQARREAGATPEVSIMLAALRQAAADHQAVLTPHETAIERAGDAAVRIDAFVDSMRRSGGLQVFNRHFKAAKAAAAARGEGFMSYTVALSRLRAQVGARLAAGGDVYAPGLMAEVFR